MKLLAALWNRRERKHGSEELRNSALDMALDFENWLSPIQNRLKDRHRSLTRQELDALNQTCTEAVLFGQQLALDLAAEVEQSSGQDRFNAKFAERYPWVNQANLDRAYRHCIYYATKTVRFR